MRTDDFDFDLPPDRIADEPAQRGTSRLLHLEPSGEIGHHRFSDLGRLLRPGDLLVVNDTRVLAARLIGRKKETGGSVEVLLVDRIDDCRWRALARPRKRLREGLELTFGDDLEARVEELPADATVVLQFSSPPEPLLDRLGSLPLPPYLGRAARSEDADWYQTVYAARPGAVAAPTAGLHFSEAQLAELERQGIGRTAITLHVGPGTFQPVTADDPADHRMQEESYEISEATANSIEAARGAGRRIVAVGTTVVRTLETVALENRGAIVAGSGRTGLFARPGFEFQVVDRLLTNFHLPRSTLLMLVSAFAGRERVLSAYRTAIEHGYRFYSYGDATLLDRPN